MHGKDHDRFVVLHSRGELVKPEQPGHVIAALSLSAPNDFSGKYVSWDADELKPYQQSSL